MKLLVWPGPTGSKRAPVSWSWRQASSLLNRPLHVLYEIHPFMYGCHAMDLVLCGAHVHALCRFSCMLFCCVFFFLFYYYYYFRGIGGAYSVPSVVCAHRNMPSTRFSKGTFFSVSIWLPVAEVTHPGKTSLYHFCCRSHLPTTIQFLFNSFSVLLCVFGLLCVSAFGTLYISPYREPIEPIFRHAFNCCYNSILFIYFLPIFSV